MLGFVSGQPVDHQAFPHRVKNPFRKRVNHKMFFFPLVKTDGKISKISLTVKSNPSLGKRRLGSIVAKRFSEIWFSPLHVKGKNGFFDGHRTPPLVSFPPHPNPPPLRGEGVKKLI
jgi:hypothetical protein